MSTINVPFFLMSMHILYAVSRRATTYLNTNAQLLINKPSNVFTPSSKNFLAAAGLKSRHAVGYVWCTHLTYTNKKFLPSSE